MVGVSVESSRIGFVREAIISCYSTSSGTLNIALKYLGALRLKKDFLNLCIVW